MSSMEPDMTAFPIIRIDQIPIMPSDILRNAVSEIIDLEQSLVTDEGPKHPLLFYLQQQLAIMHFELLDRAARERIGRLLRGEGIFETRKSFIAQHDTEESKKCATTSAQRKHLLTVENRIRPERKLQTVMKDIPADPSRMPLDIPTVSTAHRKAASEDLATHSRSGIVIAAEADNDAGDKNDDSDIGDNDSETDPPIKRNVNDQIVQHDKMMVRRQKGMSNNVPIVADMMKRAETALYKDFGNQFLVAGTERKSRYRPKKAEVKTHEELLEGVRLERREVAMARLIDKRSQHLSRAPVSKIRRRLHIITSEEKYTSNTFESDNHAGAFIRKIEKSATDSESLPGGEEAKNVLEIPIDQAKLLKTIDSIDNIRICDEVSDSCSVWYSVNQGERAILSSAEMIVNESIKCPERREGGQSGHASEPMLLECMRVVEDPTIILQKDYILSSISTIASTSASTSTSIPAPISASPAAAAAAAAATSTSAAAASSTFAPTSAPTSAAPAPAPYDPHRVAPAAASLDASIIVIEEREEYSIISRRSPATREQPHHIQSDISSNKSLELVHTIANLRAVTSSAVNVVNHERHSAGSTRQDSPPVTCNQLPLPFGIFTHPDDVVWGRDAWSDPPFEVSRPMSGITESLPYLVEGGASTHVASAAHGSINFDDDGSDFTSIASMQVTDHAITPTPNPTPAPVLTTPNPVLVSDPITDPALVHVPVLPANDSIAAPTTRSDNEFLTMTAVWGGDEVRSVDAVEQRGWKASSRSFVPRTRSKVRSASVEGSIDHKLFD